MTAGRFLNALRLQTLAVGLLLAAASGPALGATTVETIPFELYDFRVSGTGSVPLARDVDGDGYAFVPAYFSVDLSSTHTSLGQIKLFLPEDITDGTSIDFEITFDAYLDLWIDPVDSTSSGFFGALNDGLVLQADTPAHFTKSGTFAAVTASKYLYGFGLGEIALDGEYTWQANLHVDVNGDSQNDQISVTLSQLKLGDEIVVATPKEATTGEETTAQEKSEAEKTAAETKEKAAKKATKKFPKGVPVVGSFNSSASLSGSVNPAFNNIPLDGSTTLIEPLAQTPEPASLVLWTMGAVGTSLWHRRRKRMAGK